MEIAEQFCLIVLQDLMGPSATVRIEAYGTSGNQCYVENKNGAWVRLDVRLLADRYERYGMDSGNRQTIEELKTAAVWLERPVHTRDENAPPDPAADFTYPVDYRRTDGE